jgi:hypothetical protein
MHHLLDAEVTLELLAQLGLARRRLHAVLGYIGKVVRKVVNAGAKQLRQPRVSLLAVLGDDEVRPDAADPGENRIVREMHHMTARGADIGTAVDEVDGHPSF